MYQQAPEGDNETRLDIHYPLCQQFLCVSGEATGNPRLVCYPYLLYTLVNDV